MLLGEISKWQLGGDMLRRPLLFVAAGFLAAILIEYYAGAIIGFALPIGLLAGLFVMQKPKAPGLEGRDCGNLSSRNVLILKLVLVAYVISSLNFIIVSKDLDTDAIELIKLENKTGVADLSGEIKEIEKRKNSAGEKYYKIIIKTDGGTALAKYYSKDNLALKPGDIASLKGPIELPAGRRNPRCFDYRLFLRSQGITATMTAYNVDVIEERESLQGRLFSLKEEYINGLGKSTNSDTAAVLKGIMFGDKGELDADTLETFQKNGTAHILAVSGLHIGIIYGFILMIWNLLGNMTNGKFCGRKGLFFFLFNFVFFMCYIILSGFSPSVVRAVVMVLLHTFAQLTGRKYDLNNAALLVLICVLLQNPYMLFNVGLQMSFLAVLSLYLGMPFIKSICSGVFTASIIIQLGLGPFIVYNFNYLSLAGFLINVPVIFLAGIILPLGLTGMGVYIIGCLGDMIGIGDFGGGLVDLTSIPIEWLIRLLTRFNEAVEIDGITSFRVESPPLTLLAFYYLLLLVFLTEEGRLGVMRAANKLKYIFKRAVIILAISIVFSIFAGDGFDDCNLTFVDVGQGDCICIKSEGSLFHEDECYMIDGGGNENYNVGKQVLKSYLLKNGISHIDGAFVTHLHTDHYRGICELAKEGMVKKLYVYEGNKLKEDEILKETGLKSEDIEYLYAGEVVELSSREAVSLEVLWPEKKTESEYSALLEDEANENGSSLIFKLNFENRESGEESSVLVTGDLDEDGEQEILEAYKNTAAPGPNSESAVLQADILKVAHHGSKSSSSDEFLDAVKPSIAVIQVGKNNYGHPTPEVLDKLAERSVSVYRNDLNGAVGFEIKKGQVKEVRRCIIEK